MSIEDALSKLERNLGRRIERLTRRRTSPREAVQIAEDMLDEVAAKVEPTAGDTRAFPYGKLTVRVAVPEGRGPAAQAVLEHAPDLRSRIHTRLREAGCAPADAEPEVTLEILEGPAPEAWQGRDFQVDYAPGRANRPAKGEEALATPPPVRLEILEGSTADLRRHEFQLATIRLGRTPSVTDRARRAPRENDVAFDEEGSANATVSRAHAHLRWSPEEGVFRLHDDGSTHGTCIRRQGTTLEVPGPGGRGVALKSGDVLALGRARLRFIV